MRRGQSVDPYQQQLKHEKIIEQHGRSLIRATWVLAFVTAVLAAATIAKIVLPLIVNRP